MDLNVTKDQVNAAMRHVYTSAGTVLTIGTVLAVVPQDSVQPIITELQNIGDAIQQIIGSVGKLTILVGPIIGTIAAKFAFSSASPKNQAASVANTIATSPDTAKGNEAKVALLTAVTDAARVTPDIKIEGQIRTTPTIADEVPSSLVVSHTASAPSGN